MGLGEVRKKVSKGFSYVKKDSQDTRGFTIVKLRLFFPLARHNRKIVGNFLEEHDTLDASSICQWAAGYKDV